MASAISPIPLPVKAQRNYWWRLLKTLGREVYRTWRQELLASVLISVVAFLITRRTDPEAWKNFEVALVAAAVVLVLFACFHFLRAPWLSHVQIAQGGQPIHGIFGLVGMITVVVLLAAPIVLWLYLRPVQEMVVTATVPCPSIPPVVVKMLNSPAAIKLPAGGTKIIQKGTGNTANPGANSAPINQGPCGVVQNGGSNNTASPSCAPPEANVTSTYECGAAGGEYQCVVTLHTDRQLDKNLGFRLGFDQTIEKYTVKTSVGMAAFGGELVTQDGSLRPNNIFRFTLIAPTAIPAGGEIYVTVTAKDPIHTTGWQRGF
jgi:hypothetical protein